MVIAEIALNICQGAKFLELYGLPDSSNTGKMRLIYREQSRHDQKHLQSRLY